MIFQNATKNVYILFSIDPKPISLAEIAKKGPNLEVRGAKLKIGKYVLYGTPIRKNKVLKPTLSGF